MHLSKHIKMYFFDCWLYSDTSLVAQTVKHLPTMQEAWVQSLGQEDLLEKEMATYSSILAWKIPWMEEPGRLQSRGSQRVGHDWATSFSLNLSFTFQDRCNYSLWTSGFSYARQRWSWTVTLRTMGGIDCM